MTVCSIQQRLWTSSQLCTLGTPKVASPFWWPHLVHHKNLPIFFAVSTGSTGPIFIGSIGPLTAFRILRGPKVAGGACQGQGSRVTAELTPKTTRHFLTPRLRGLPEIFQQKWWFYGIFWWYVYVIINLWFAYVYSEQAADLGREFEWFFGQISSDSAGFSV